MSYPIRSISRGSRTNKGGENIKIGKKIFAALSAFALVTLGMFAVSLMTTNAVVTYNAGATATENITEMIEDLTPSFILLVFVMVFMLMLMTIVDRIGRH